MKIKNRACFFHRKYYLEKLYYVRESKRSRGSEGTYVEGWKATPATSKKLKIAPKE
jgi:hypothetical protein